MVELHTGSSDITIAIALLRQDAPNDRLGEDVQVGAVLVREVECLPGKWHIISFAARYSKKEWEEARMEQLGGYVR